MIENHWNPTGLHMASMEAGTEAAQAGFLASSPPLGGEAEKPEADTTSRQEEV